MKTDQAKKLTDEALEKLSAALQAGKSEELVNHLATMARFHRYSFRNILLIASQCPHASRVAGFQTWKKLGRYVKKGEKGLMVIAPVVIKTEADSRDSNVTEDETMIRFKAAHVFDISQTDGEPLPAISTASGDPGQYIERLKKLVIDQSIELLYVPDMGGPLGSSSKGKITILSDLPPAEEFTTLVHELAHELLHWRDERPETKTARETEAEAVAFVVGHAVGLDVLSASRDYIQLYRGEVATLAESLDRIQRTATLILSALDPE